MTKKAFYMTCLLLAGLVKTINAQAPFKVGDYVESNATTVSTVWVPCRVSGPLTGGMYVLDCGATRTFAVPSQVRARAAASQDKQVEAETAAALARQPKGNSLGAKFGTREPRVCTDRKAPTRGAPSVQQATQYLICDEEVQVFRSLVLITNVKVQVAPVSKPVDPQVTHVADIDPRQPVWDIRGSYTRYGCAELSSMLGAPNLSDYARTHNCNVVEQPNATGSCWKNTFGDWHCMMEDTRNLFVNVRNNVMPPPGN